MPRPYGIEHFSKFFKEYENDYVIIGGGAASVLLEDEGLEFRSTKDIDVVLLTNSSKEFNQKITEYIKLGSYKTREAAEGKPRYYRFLEPANIEFPKIIEIFSRNENEIELEEGQYIFPVHSDNSEKLSAILLGDEYFELIKKCSTKSSEGFSVINFIGNICLKARAYRDLFEREEEEKKAKKHRNDIIRLAQSLTDEDSFVLNGTPRKDLETVLDNIYKEVNDRSIKQILGSGTPDKTEVIETLKKVFFTS